LLFSGNSELFKSDVLGLDKSGIAAWGKLDIPQSWLWKTSYRGRLSASFWRSTIPRYFVIESNSL
jgi:hypothetical protein